MNGGNGGMVEGINEPEKINNPEKVGDDTIK